MATSAFENVEVARDAVVMDISVAGHAEGARCAPAEPVFQVFTVGHDDIVEIRGYPDCRAPVPDRRTSKGAARRSTEQLGASR